MAIAEARRYPLASSHTGTGGEWTPAQLRRLHALGGIASARPEPARGLNLKLAGLKRYGNDFCGGIGSDTGGFNSLPGRRHDAAAKPLRYPFESRDGKVRFVRQRSGRRLFDLNRDGVAHYGLFADLVADMQHQTPGAGLRPLFHSAEAYLRMWERATAHK